MTVCVTWVAVVAALLVARPLQAANADVTIVNGVYQGIVLAVDPTTPEPTDATAFLNEIQAFLQAGSEALHTAIGASFGDAKLVLPRSWDTSSFGAVLSAEPEMTIASADILLHDTADTVPSTLQSELCGVPGRRIEVPISFLSLTAEEESTYGTTGAILAHEWAHYRYGVHDEHGYTNDPVYTPAYTDAYLVTGCSVGEITGTWRPSCSGTATCRPNNDDCYFCMDDALTASAVQASLGYLPALSTGKFCDNSTHNYNAPTPQNLLCDQRSVMEVISAHPDYPSMNSAGPVPTVTVAVYEEPLGRVMLVLDTPPNTGEVLSYTQLLSSLQEPLTQYNSLDVAMVSYKPLNTDEVQLDSLRPFNPITDDYNSLTSLLPQTESRSSVPDLGQVLMKILERDDFTDEYTPGTLLVIPVTNEIMEASKLNGTLGALLRSRHVKPLLLFPEVSPELAAAASFLQHSGARFIARNDTTGPLEYASMAATDEVYAFADNTYQNDHAIVKVDTVELASGESFTSQLWYEGNIAQHCFAVLTTTGNIAELELKYVRWGSFATCSEANYCSFPGDAIVYSESTLTASNIGQEWHLQVTNIGTSAAQVTLTRSVANFVQQTEQELSVDVWGSYGRGPMAILPQNERFTLYASVLNRGMQVLGSNVHVWADVDVQLPEAAVEQITGLELLDGGVLPDVRTDDSVFSAYLATAEYPAGTVVTVRSITVESHSITGEVLIPVSSSRRKRKATLAASGLFTGRPEDEECCGSFVQSPNVELSHASKGYYLYLTDPISPILAERIVETATEEPAVTTPPATEEPPATTDPATEEPPVTTAPATEEPPATTAPGTEEPPVTTPPATEEPSATTASETEEPVATPPPATDAPTATPPPNTETPTETTAGVASSESSLIKIVLQTAVALCVAALMRR